MESDPDRSVAYQFGAIGGDIAGGMTQVVNSYLAWRFTTFRSVLVRSRDASRQRGRGFGRFCTAFLAVTRIDRRRAICVFHLSQRGSFVREGLLLALASRRSVGTVAHLHGSTFGRFASAHPRIVRAVLTRADEVIVLSAEAENAVRNVAPHASVHLIPNAVEPGRATTKQNLVVFGGAVSHRKGVDTLLTAWRGISSKGTWRLLIAGPHAGLEVETSEADQIEVLGAIPHGQLMSLLDRSRIAVLPSRDEAMPMFILEALARKNCVIATPVGGVGEVLRENAGCLVEPGDSDALRDALASVIVDDGLRARYVEAGWRRYLASYGADEVFPRIESVWLAAYRRSAGSGDHVPRA